MKQYLLVGCLVLFISCTDDYFSDFCDAVINNDAAFVRQEVDDILKDLSPIYNTSDNLGHFENILFLIDELNRDDCLFASVLCYACIYTYPLQSEILIEVEEGNFYVRKVLDISTASDSEMYFVGMHD